MKHCNQYEALRNKAFISLSANRSTLKSVMEITGPYKVDFRPPNSLRSALGFKNRVYHAGFNESENIVNVLTVNSIFIEVNITCQRGSARQCSKSHMHFKGKSSFLTPSSPQINHQIDMKIGTFDYV
jgi:hypothetical protein